MSMKLLNVTPVKVICEIGKAINELREVDRVFKLNNLKALEGVFECDVTPDMMNYKDTVRGLINGEIIATRLGREYQINLLPYTNPTAFDDLTKAQKRDLELILNQTDLKAQMHGFNPWAPAIYANTKNCNSRVVKNLEKKGLIAKEGINYQLTRKAVLVQVRLKASLVTTQEETQDPLESLEALRLTHFKSIMPTRFIKAITELNLDDEQLKVIETMIYVLYRDLRAVEIYDFLDRRALIEKVEARWASLQGQTNTLIGSMIKDSLLTQTREITEGLVTAPSLTIWLNEDLVKASEDPVNGGINYPDYKHQETQEAQETQETQGPKEWTEEELNVLYRAILIDLKRAGDRNNHFVELEYVRKVFKSTLEAGDKNGFVLAKIQELGLKYIAKLQDKKVVFGLDTSSLKALLSSNDQETQETQEVQEVQEVQEEPQEATQLGLELDKMNLTAREKQLLKRILDLLFEQGFSDVTWEDVSEGINPKVLTSLIMKQIIEVQETEVVEYYTSLINPRGSNWEYKTHYLLHLNPLYYSRLKPEWT